MTAAVRAGESSGPLASSPGDGSNCAGGVTGDSAAAPGGGCGVGSAGVGVTAAGVAVGLATDVGSTGACGPGAGGTGLVGAGAGGVTGAGATGAGVTPGRLGVTGAGVARLGVTGEGFTGLGVARLGVTGVGVTGAEASGSGSRAADVTITTVTECGCPGITGSPTPLPCAARCEGPDTTASPGSDAQVPTATRVKIILLLDMAALPQLLPTRISALLSGRPVMDTFSCFLACTSHEVKVSGNPFT